MDVRGSQQILTTGDVGDVLERIVHDYGEMIGGADVLAGKHHVSQQQRIHLDGTVLQVLEVESAGLGGGLLRIQPP